MKRSLKIPPIVGIVLGLVFYEIANTFLYLVQPVFFPSFLRLVGLIIVLYYLCAASYRRLSGNIGLVFTLLIIWTIIIILRGSLIGNYAPGYEGPFKNVIQRALLSDYGAGSYLIPLVSLVGISYSDFYYLRKLAVLLCITALLFTFLARTQIANGLVTQGVASVVESGGEELTIRHLIAALYPGYGVILLFLFLYSFIKGKVSILFPLAIFIFFLCNAIGGGRGQTGLNLVYLLFFFLLIIKYPFNKRFGNTLENCKRTNRFPYLILGMFFVFSLFYLYSHTSVFDYVLERSFGEKALSGEFQNGSRDVLLNDMISDFNNSPFDWIIGRGVNGVYMTPHSLDGGVRIWMEWGYAYLILKGGLLYLFFVVTCMIHAVYLGYLKSKNTFSKCLATMCVVYLFNLVSTTSEPQFSSFFLISWLCFGLLERKSFRMVDDEVLYGYFNYKNYTP